MTAQRPFAPTVPTTQVQESLAAIGRIHRYAAEQLAATLITAQRFEHTHAGVRRLTPAQTLLLDQLNRALLGRLIAIVQQGDESVIAALQSRTPVLPVGVETHQSINQLVQLYGQHIQIIFRR